MFAGEAPEPLAFRVRPRPDEAFDSWMDRLTARHEVTRAELFRHLGCDPRLASRDLARGWDGLEIDGRSALHRLVERLAWAVETSEKAVMATFVPAPQAALLPPAMRVFACPVCWRQSLGRGEPLILARDWILRASWMCRRHRLPLAPLRGLVAEQRARAATQILEEQAIGVRRLRRRAQLSPAMLAYNGRLVSQLLGKRAAGLRRGERGYQVRFAANPFHLSRARIALLMGAHGDRSRPAERFEDFVARPAPALIKAGANLLNPKARRGDKSPSVPEGLVTVRVSRWQATLADLLVAYAQIMIPRAGATGPSDR